MGRWQLPQFSSPKSWNWSWEGLKIVKNPLVTASVEKDLKTFLNILSKVGKVFQFSKMAI